VLRTIRTFVALQNFSRIFPGDVNTTRYAANEMNSRKGAKAQSNAKAPPLRLRAFA
jgi:hypothetical protein